ncbi:MAG: T9SS type A sorting domain-containing protein [candidate division WOR-3 bacterium]|nr:MAG: T9SS type A sorting domain-containing protein [candidate division WOR-3 bacterium]
MHLFLIIINISIEVEQYTNTNYLYDITGRDSIIYCATNGGVVAYDYVDDSFYVLGDIDGLQLSRQQCLGLDSSGYVWIGNDRGLALIDADFGRIQIYPSEYSVPTFIQEIACLTDSIYIGSTYGLLFIDTKGTPDDFADDSRLRLFDETQGLASPDVRTIAFDDTSIWVGTDNGITQFRKDFSSFVQYDRSDGLLSNSVNKIAFIDTAVYVGSDSGLNVFRDDHFDTMLQGYEVNDIVHIDDSFVLALDTLSQIGILHEGSLTIAKSGLPYRCKVLSLAQIDGNLFSGLGNRYILDYYGEGLGRFDFGNNRWEIIKNQGLPSNHISEITANEYGVFIACGARRSESRGIGWLTDDGEWIHYARGSVIPSNHIHRCTTAPDGKIWFAVNAFSNTDSSVMVFSFDPQHDEWQFIVNRYLGMEGTEAVWDLEFDRHNNMYLALGGPTDKLWLVDSVLSMVYFLGDRTPGFNVEIALDSMGRIYRTMTGDVGGLVMINTKNTLFNRSDDDVVKFSVSDGLLSKYAWGCLVDKNNILYIANEVGLSIYDGVNFFGITGISEQELFDVELDSEGRIWIMARDGIYFYDPRLDVVDGWTFTELGVHFEFWSFSNEVIQIQGFEFDPLRRCFWIGGETGLLRLEISSDTLPGLDNVLVYPNPVVGKNTVRIKNIPADSRVNIYTVAGRLIAEGLLVDGVFGEVVWEIPEDVGSGLYIAFVKSSRGNKVYKFAIVR